MKLNPQRINELLALEAEGKLSSDQQNKIAIARSGGLFPDPIDMSREVGMGSQAAASFAVTPGGRRSYYEDKFGKDNVMGVETPGIVPPPAPYVRPQAGTISNSGPSFQGQRTASASVPSVENIYVRDNAQGRWYPENRPGLSANDIASLTGEIPEIALGTYGALQGAGLASIAGAGIGAAAGKTLRTKIAHSIGANDNLSTKQELIDIGLAGAAGAAGEALGQGASKVIGKVAAPFADRVTPEARQAIEFMSTEADKRGLKAPNVKLLPAEATQSGGKSPWVLDLMQNVTENAFLGGKSISDFKNERDSFIKALSQHIVDQIGGKKSSAEVGQAFVDLLKSKRDVFAEAANKLYDPIRQAADPVLTQVPKQSQVATGLIDQSGNPIMRTVTKMVEEPTGGATFDISPAKQFAEKILKTGKAAGNIEPELSGDILANGIVKASDNPTFSEIQSLRSRLLAYLRKTEMADKSSPGVGVAKKTLSMIDESTRDGLGKFDSALLQQWDDANAFYKEGKQKYYSELMSRLIRTSEKSGRPEGIIDMVFQPDAASNVRQVMEMADNPGKESFRRIVADGLMTKATDSKTGTVLGSRLHDALDGKGGFGTDTLKEIFTPDQVKAMKGLANALEVTQSKSARGTGSVWIELTQAGAAWNLVYKGVSATPLSITLGPYALGKILTSETGSKLLSEGFAKEAIPAKEAARWMSRLVALGTPLEDRAAALSEKKPDPTEPIIPIPSR